MNNPGAYFNASAGAVIPLFWGLAAILFLCVLIGVAWSVKK
jgi:hypothetical protein